MAKIRKNKRRKKYQFDKNRKRMRKHHVPKIKCKVVDEQWSEKKSCSKNLKEMGLVFNVNDDINPTKQPPTVAEENLEVVPTAVVSALEEDANEPREKGFRITKNQVEFLSYMLDKYGEDYKAMTRDKRNILQMTWNQFRAKINVFKGIPEQYEPYLKSRGKLMEVYDDTIVDDSGLVAAV